MDQPSITQDETKASDITIFLEPLYRVKGWIKFAGIMTIIAGALEVLTVWGVIIAWIPIWMGIVLISTANLLEQAHAARNSTVMHQSFEKMGLYFKLLGVFQIITAVVIVLAIIAAVIITVYFGQAAMGV